VIPSPFFGPSLFPLELRRCDPQDDVSDLHDERHYDEYQPQDSRLEKEWDKGLTLSWEKLGIKL
jgi:hypothetical protein